MKNIIISIFWMVLSCQMAAAQTRISGWVKDAQSQELLLGATIMEQGTSNGTFTNNNGYFTLITQKDSALRISFVGYKPQVPHYIAHQDTLFNIFLVADNTLEEVLVQASRQLNTNVATLSYKEMLSIPALGGKPDVLKALQLLPGIQSQNEGSSLLLVRGGTPGQNLYLLDNVPLIYVNHLGGFASVFNPDIINKVEVYKGGFSPKFGGKLSSVVNITQKEGDVSGKKGSLGIGITDASFSFEGPMKKKNTSFIVTGRKTMVDPLMALASSIGGDYIVSYGFHDINTKFTWKPDTKNSLHFNFYQGDDYLNYWSSTNENGQQEKNRLSNVWGNWLGALRWNRVLSNKLFVSSSLSYTRYRLKFRQSFLSKNEDRTYEFEKRYLSTVQDLSLRSGWEYQWFRNHALEFGLQSALLIHMPNNTFQSNSEIEPVKERVLSNETALYVNEKWALGAKSELQAGFRLVNYQAKDFNQNVLEPRLNLNVGLSAHQALNLSYMRVYQFSHLMFTAGGIANNEVWVPSDKNISPAYSDQLTLGWSGTLFDGMLSAEANIYYKEMAELSAYKEGFANLVGDTNWRSKIESGGKGNSRGFEFLLRKEMGDWTGFASYTYSKTQYQFPNINQGKAYLYEYDRPHSISMSLGKSLSEKWSMSMAWVYQTGLPYTPVKGRHLTPGTSPNDNGEYPYYEVLIYGERNSDRMRDYHRLDIGFNREVITKRNRRAIWTYSIYNVYSRQNPYYYYYNHNASGEIIRAEEGDYKPLALYQISFLPIIPTISYKVFFDGSRAKDKSSRKSVKQKFNNWLYMEN